jgi:hypothetical protein
MQLLVGAAPRRDNKDLFQISNGPPITYFLKSIMSVTFNVFMVSVDSSDRQ